VLLELKREMGPIAFSAQYQQSPIPPGGTIIKRKWLTTYDEVQPQPGDRIIMSWDIALSETESGDYSACVVLLRRREVFYILEALRGRFPFDTLKQKVMEVKRRYASGTLLIEDSPISRGLIQNLRDKSINVTDYKPDTNKLARVIAQRGARFAFPGMLVGLRNASLNYWLFRGATTIRSTLSPRG
jgi:phage terminase large subunit-like protein